MLNAKATFNAGISGAKEHSALYDFLNDQIRVPVTFDDLLRGQVVTAVAALDKLIHDLIRIGMCATFSGARVPTPKYSAEAIPLKLHHELVSATIPPKEIIFENAVVEKLGHLSFQDPQKISNGLSLIWNEDNKWVKIGALLGLEGGYASTQMKLISIRRNAIVHQSDMDSLTNSKLSISKSECESMTNFVEACGNAIVDLVI